MSAPIQQQKISKQERRTLKKQRRSIHNVVKDEGLTVSTEPTCHLIVGNGGLGNGVKQEEIAMIFRKYGTVIDIMMKPMKAYCFVTMNSADGARSATENLNGRLLKCPEEISLSGAKFYLNYIKHVPGCEIPNMTLPPGLILLENFVSEAEEQELLQSVKWDTVDKNISPGARSHMKHRQVKHYGYEFMYGINNVDINCPLEDDIPSECENILSRMVQLKLISCVPNQLTVNQYQPGQGIPPHIDTHSAFEDSIISLSLGSQAVMEFKSPDGRHLPVLLPQRSLLIMTGESRYVWTHGITPRKSDIVSLSQLHNLGVAEGQKNSEQCHDCPSAASVNDSDCFNVKDDSYSHFVGSVDHDKQCSLQDEVGVSDTSKLSSVDDAILDEASHLRERLNAFNEGTGTNEPNAVKNQEMSDNSSLVAADSVKVSEVSIQSDCNDIKANHDVDGKIISSDCDSTNTVETYACSDCTTSSKCQLPLKKDRLTLVHRGVRTSFTFRRVLRGPCKCAFPAQCDSQKHQLSEIKSTSAVEGVQRNENTNEKPALPVSEKEAQKLEAELVHQVYEDIASHFSDTRHSPWPRVVDFLKAQPPGSLILDVGCGNGKYLGANNTAYKLGCDRSENLCLISAERGFPVFVCDCLAVPLRFNSVDAVISIAVIHHLSTWERRRQAVEQLVQVLRPGGHALIYVWALEQELNKKKSNYLKESKSQDRKTDGSTEDYKIPVCGNSKEQPVSTQSVPDHSLTQDKEEEKKYLTVHVNRTAFQSQDLLVPWHLRDNKSKSKAAKSSSESKAPESSSESNEYNSNQGAMTSSSPAGYIGPVYRRYYHVFKQGELEQLCESVPGVNIVNSYYDQGNWCVILMKSEN